MKLSLEGKVALVTGASRGIGKATALALAEYGCDVAVNCLHSLDRAEKVVSAIRSLWRRGVAAQGDTSKPPEVERIVAQAVQALGPIDFLVNNAGISSSCWVHEMSLEEWQRTIDCDLTSVFLVTWQLLPSILPAPFSLRWPSTGERGGATAERPRSLGPCRDSGGDRYDHRPLSPPGRGFLNGLGTIAKWRGDHGLVPEPSSCAGNLLNCDPKQGGVSR